MAQPPVSKSRSRKSRQRDRLEQKRHKKPSPWTLRTFLMGLLFWATGFAALYLGGQFQFMLLLPGQKATSTVISTTDFSCEDLNLTAINRQRAATEVPPVFTVDASQNENGIRAMERFFKNLAASYGSGTNQPLTTALPIEKAVGDMLILLNIHLEPAEVMKAVAPQSQSDVYQIITRALTRLSTNAIISLSDRNTGFGGLTETRQISLLYADNTQSKTISLSSLPTSSEALETTLTLLQAGKPWPRQLKKVLFNLLSPWAKPNLQYEPGFTKKAREEAKAKVQPVIVIIKAGTTLVDDGERITPAIQARLQAYAKKMQALQSDRERMLHTLGNGLLLLLVLFICGSLLRTIKPELLSNDSALTIMLLLSLLGIAPLKAMLIYATQIGWLNQALLIHLFPAALPAILGTVFIGSGAALAVGLWISCVAAIMLDHNLTVLLLGLLVTVTTIRASFGVHHRSRIFKAGLLAGLAEGAFALTSYILLQPDWHALLHQASCGLISGFVCAFMALLLIPLFEKLFGITTDITLLELSDMGNPLLQRLAIEAPGTYHHSLMVANLGAAAAQEINANALAVRVGAYFHDIGKLTKPEFFIENSSHRANPHDDLSPNMSTLVITSHVKEGLTLASRHNLPQVVKDAISQHHGTGLVTYFYHRARKQIDNESTSDSSSTKNAARINEEDFRYPGPRPSSREMAILTLADSVEAASRSIEKPTAARIENMVHEIVEQKMCDGQLEECELTLGELSTIQKSFIFALTNMLHGRVAYPQQHATGNQ